MVPLEEWLALRGPSYAIALDNRRDQICSAVSVRLAAAFPALCYDPGRPDAVAFQRLTYANTPKRFHRLMQVVLRLSALSVIEREYRWGWPILQRYDVDLNQLLAQVHWYFEAARQFATPDPIDRRPLLALETRTLQVVRAVAPMPMGVRTNGNGHHRLN